MAINNTLRTIDSHNVVAKLEGSDPTLKDEYVVYSAHWDHLGVGAPVKGDKIYNGALDNASGVATVLEIARAFTQVQPAPKRSILFLMVTAEEQGLLGSQYYSVNPLYPLAKTLANINIDGVNQWGRTKDLTVVGLGASDLDDYLRDAAAEQGRTLRPIRNRRKASTTGRITSTSPSRACRRSIRTRASISSASRPTTARRSATSTPKNDYHAPSDEVKPDWDLRGAVEDARAVPRGRLPRRERRQVAGVEGRERVQSEARKVAWEIRTASLSAVRSGTNRKAGTTRAERRQRAAASVLWDSRDTCSPEPFLVELEEPPGLFVADAAFTNGELDVVAQLSHERLGVELDVIEHFLDRVPLDHRVEDDVASSVEADVHGVRVAEQVVEVAQDLLVGADQEHSQIVRFAVDAVERQRALDITCDSDGKIDQFVDRRDVKRTLPLHAFNGEPYYLGVFLVGAYQEILGDLHNLFGDTHAVHVSLDETRQRRARRGDQGRHGQAKCSTTWSSTPKRWCASCGTTSSSPSARAASATRSPAGCSSSTKKGCRATRISRIPKSGSRRPLSAFRSGRLGLPICADGQRTATHFSFR